MPRSFPSSLASPARAARTRTAGSISFLRWNNIVPNDVAGIDTCILKVRGGGDEKGIFSVIQVLDYPYSDQKEFLWPAGSD